MAQPSMGQMNISKEYLFSLINIVHTHHLCLLGTKNRLVASGLPVGQRMSSRRTRMRTVLIRLRPSASLWRDGWHRLMFKVSRDCITHTHTHSRGLPGPSDGWLWRLQSDSRSLLCPKKPISEAQPKSSQHGVMESNRKLSCEWPSSTGISDKVQGEKDSKKCCNKALCLVILLTKWVAPGGERGG